MCDPACNRVGTRRPRASVSGGCQRPPPLWIEFKMLPIAERDLAWMLECCREHAEADYHVLRDGDAVLFSRAHDFAFARLLAL